MLITFAILVVVVVLCVVLWFSTIELGIDLEHHGVHASGKVEVKAIFGLLRVERRLTNLEPKWSKEGPAVKSVHEFTAKNEKEETTLTTSEVWGYLRHWRTYAGVFKKVWQPFRKFLRTVSVSAVRVQVTVGTGDPVSTGCTVGGVWGGLGIAIGELSSLLQLTAVPDIAVTPDFETARLDASMHCIARTRVGHAIVGTARMLWMWMKVKKTLKRVTSRPRKEEKTWNTPSRG